ncbi:prepilin-type N-terminal cleavage/methylation domain-containing protein [Corallococcus praedator]|uniref:Prepilin-type N-terminal cleavage/methylation domain-containing protein n=1 Tax=Corallococcus praedator TaxID=2316724 RepID=A0ABX9QKQ5_9BACT|nr:MULTISPECIES: prepilin-type N-terminal cleavage/methylation domain-containing protein [Corallococcus]RKH15754.1 prepilin-type N-terminal cleavage/methylation domain-containing protein [Corallococcus sp. CA047B]RKH30010.1 prepilin-type N-terminal cleavage/methylation domain-containing protein [Corallococcus sp. CA031C]RKI09353.1 prepilin-type N-terminal cleavage/methylation domain-containing protein [Corallococcus praedator]
MKRTKGMTLLELMTAVAVIGVLIALAVAGTQGRIDRQRETSATRELWGAALRARQLSISTNQPVRIVVDPDVEQPDGRRYNVARWERLKCGDDLNNPDEWTVDKCPSPSCLAKTCRADSNCCSETGPDIVIPGTMVAADINNLCFLPGSGRPVFNRMDCMQGSLGSPADIAAAAPADNSILFRFASDRPKSVLMVEPLTGLSSVMDCDSQAATTNDATRKDERLAAACTAP